MRQSRLGDAALSGCGGRVGWLVRVAGTGRLGGAVLLPSAAVRDSRDDARRSRRRIHARTSRISGRKGSAITATTTIASTWPAAYFPETREEPDMSQTFGGGKRSHHRTSLQGLCPIYHSWGNRGSRPDPPPHVDLIQVYRSWPYRAVLEIHGPCQAIDVDRPLPGKVSRSRQQDLSDRRWRCRRSATVRHLRAHGPMNGSRSADGSRTVTEASRGLAPTAQKEKG